MEYINRDMTQACSRGTVEEVRELVNSYGLSYSPAWSRGYVLLRKALEKSQIEVAKLLISRGSKVNSKSLKLTDTPLHFAVRNGDVEVVEMLLNRGAHVNAKNQYGTTPLHEAAEYQKVEVVELLLKHYAVDAADNDGKRPLHVAAQKGNSFMVGSLLKNGASVNGAITSSWLKGKSPLHFAVESGNNEVVALLLSGGADIDVKEQGGETPLHIAAQQGFTCIAEQLLNHGASPHSTLSEGRGSTPLHLASGSGHGEVVKLLLNRGADVNASTNDHSTPLHIAIKGRHEKVTISSSLNGLFLKLTGQRIMEHGAKVDTQDKDGHEEVVKLLLNRGADVNASTNDNSTPLHIAIKSRHEKVISLLLEHGAKVDTQDKDGKTALHLAVETGSSVIVEEVLKYCPDINNESNRKSLKTAVLGYGDTYEDIVQALLKYGLTVDSKEAGNPDLFHAAVEKGGLKIVEDLLKCGADVNMLHTSFSKEGFTPLHAAAKSKQKEVAELLLSHKADVNAKCKTGKTPIFYAIEKADLKTTRLLLTHGANVKNNTELLVTAVKNGYTEIVEALLQHDADVNTSDEYGRTPLHFTAMDGKERYIFFESFAGDEYGRTPLHFTAMDGIEQLLRHHYFKLRKLRNFFYSFFTNKDPDDNKPVVNDNAEIAKLLLSKGANVHAQAKNGVTTLHAASEKGFAEVVEAVLGQGADVNAKLKDKITALHIATQNGHQQVVKVLLAYGARVDSKMKSDLTPLHVGAEKGYPEIIEILLNFGADADATDELGRTALHIASRKGHSQVVVTLLEYGSDVNITSKRNETPLADAIAGIDAFNKIDPYLDYDSSDYDSDGECYYDRGVSPCEGTAGVLENHIVKMKTANLYVSENNLLSLRDTLKLHSFQNDCEKELASIMSEMLTDTNISMYDILAKLHSLPDYMRNENIVQVFKTGDYKTKFPIYASMIDNNFRKGMERKDLLDRGHGISHFLFENFPEVDDFPDECTEKIFSYLTNEDLRVLINVCEPRPQHQ